MRETIKGGQQQQKMKALKLLIGPVRMGMLLKFPLWISKSSLGADA